MPSGSTTQESQSGKETSTLSLQDGIVPIFYTKPVCTMTITYMTHQQARTLLDTKSCLPLLLPNLSTNTTNQPQAKTCTDFEEDPSKRRLRPNDEQCEILWKTFNQNPLPSSALRQKLANQLGMTPRAIQIWFQNRRQWFRTKGVADMNSKNGPRSLKKNRHLFHEYYQHHNDNNHIPNQSNSATPSSPTLSSSKSSPSTPPSSSSSSSSLLTQTVPNHLSKLNVLADVIDERQAKRWRPWM